jgi:hypothetical protein
MSFDFPFVRLFGVYLLIGSSGVENMITENIRNIRQFGKYYKMPISMAGIG